MKTQVATIFLTFVLVLGPDVNAGPCGQRFTKPNCGDGVSHPTCGKTVVSGIPPVCGTAYRRGRTTWSNATKIAQSGCNFVNDPNSLCTEQTADCEYYTEGTCENYDKLECWAELRVGGQWALVSAGAAGGLKYVVTDVDQVTTLGPVLRGTGTWATET